MATERPAGTPPPNSVFPKSYAAWRRWLAAHHSREEGVWVITYKKDKGAPRLEYDGLVEEALCYGWVDSRPGKLDDARTMLYFAPRKPTSAWSAPNKARVARLIADGRMAPPGLAKVDLAKRTGLWEKLDAVEALEEPPDLRAAFRRHAGSAANWAAFPRSVKRGILEWIGAAKRPETRARRVDETAREAAANRRANQWRQP